jgi:hypothetical protein
MNGRRAAQMGDKTYTKTKITFFWVSVPMRKILLAGARL